VTIDNVRDVFFPVMVYMFVKHSIVHVLLSYVLSCTLVNSTLVTHRLCLCGLCEDQWQNIICQ